jgi:hypothetical protein
MVGTTKICFIGIFFPWKTATISQYLNGRGNRIISTQAHIGRRCPFANKFFTWCIPKWTFTGDRIHSNFNLRIFHSDHFQNIKKLYYGFSKNDTFFIASPEKALLDVFYLMS